jgi:signal transduction histidine kinase
VDERLPIDLCALLHQSADIVDPQAGAGPLRFQCKTEQRLNFKCQDMQHCSLTGSPGLMRIALTNLLDNARKYAPQSTIDVSVLLDASSLHMHLRDHGPGIAASDHETIFERFRRGANAGSQKGNGLGLYVSREIIRGHGGELRLLSSDTSGSLFEISLPLAVTTQDIAGANT